MWIGDRIYFTSDRDGTSNIYAQSFAPIEEAGLSEDDKAWIYWRTAAGLYELDIG